jgi:hypothetical protein
MGWRRSSDVRSRDRPTKPVLAAFLALMCFSGTCFERHTTVTLIRNTNPPSFKLSGNGWLQQVAVSGPFLSVEQMNSMPQSESNVLWRVYAKGFRRAHDIPEITYGSTSDWGRQAIPVNGELPKPLEEGKVYVIWGTLSEANFRALCFSIHNGVVAQVNCQP